MSKNECCFCDIVADEIPTEKVFEDDQILAILAKVPTPLGHSIIFPKRHVLNFSELTPDEQIRFARIWGIVEIALITLLNKPRAINLKSGGFVPHMHLHIYPADADTSWDEVKDMFENKNISEKDHTERQNLLLQLTQVLKTYETDRYNSPSQNPYSRLRT